jgi:amidase
MELNPEALTIARERDAERAASTVQGPLHGIPVLLKDNIATAGPMHTTAGNFALKDWQASRDAFLVQQLRDAGAIILGKNNLSEWANYTDPCMPNGFSSLGGQTRNPFGPYDTLGSSSGSAVSVAAELTTVSVGSETAGSLVQPARLNGVVGMRPSKGLVSGDYVIPLEPTLDTAGPMGRSVTDVAVLLTALAATDPNEPRGADASALADTDFTQSLSLDEARKLRVGVVRFDVFATTLFTDTFTTAAPEEQQKMLDALAQLPQIGLSGATQAHIDALKAQGIEVVEIKQSELPPGRPDIHIAFIDYGFQDGVSRLFGAMEPAAPIRSLADVAATVNEEPAARAPYGQRYVEGSAATTITTEEYAAAVAEARQVAEAWLTGVYQAYQVDVVLTGIFYTSAGPAGVPALNVPVGRSPDSTTGAPGEPLGVTISGPYLSDAKVIAVGYALEQALKADMTPDLEATIKQIDAVTGR